MTERAREAADRLVSDAPLRAKAVAKRSRLGEPIPMGVEETVLTDDAEEQPEHQRNCPEDGPRQRLAAAYPLAWSFGGGHLVWLARCRGTPPFSGPGLSEGT